MASVTPFLWFEDQAAEALALYASAFGVVPEGPGTGPGFVMATLSLPGLDLTLFDGGPAPFGFNESMSLFVSVETQEEVDHLWEALTAEGGHPGRCGWLQDRFGVSWQIVPTALGRLMGDPDPVRAGRVRDAMMGMSKLQIDELQSAYDG